MRKARQQPAANLNKADCKVNISNPEECAMRADDIQPQFQNNNDDIIQKRDLTNSRKPTITLASLNKLKKMRAAKDLENLMRGDFLEIIYGAPAEEQGGGI